MNRLAQAVNCNTTEMNTLLHVQKRISRIFLKKLAFILLMQAKKYLHDVVALIYRHGNRS